MDIMQLATRLLREQFSGVSADKASSAISGLLGDGKGGLDLGAIVSQLSSNGGLQNIVQSWLGDGANQAISPSQLMDVFGSKKLSGFADTLGVDQQQATNGLGEMLPRLIDRSSSGGNLLESVGGIGGALDIAKGLFK